MYLDLNGRTCVVVGGGAVGERKVQTLLECGARVVIISPELGDGLADKVDDDRLVWHRRSYAVGDLEGAFLAIAATDDDVVNRQIAREAENRNVLLNVVDVTPLCSFIAPSVVRRGEVLVATSTGGGSPALARKLRQELSRSAALEYADLAPLLREARGELRNRGVTLNGDHWQASITDDVMDLVRDGAEDGARRLLMANLLYGTECDCEEGTCKMWDEETLTSGLAGRKASPKRTPAL